MRAAPFALVVASLAGPAAHAVEVGDPAAGHAIARETCAECHAVEPGAVARLYADVPSFQEVASLPEMSGLALTAFLQTSHESMPDFILSPAERDDLVAYILSLR